MSIFCVFGRKPLLRGTQYPAAEQDWNQGPSESKPMSFLVPFNHLAVCNMAEFTLLVPDKAVLRLLLISFLL